MRPAIIVMALGAVTCLLALAIWLSRPTQAATVQTLVFSAIPKTSVSSRLRLPTSDDAKPSTAPQFVNGAAASANGTTVIHRKTTRSGNVILWPDDAIREDGSYDAIIHFHGIPQALEPALRESGLRAVLLILESGVITNDYRDAYGLPGTLDRLLSALRVQVSDIAGGKLVHEAKVAVSSWSAGSGAILPMLKRHDEAARLDAVVLSDSLHSAFLDPIRRTISDLQLEPVRAFASEAIEGRRLFALSHTSIQTPDFASTTETATRLLELLQLSPVHVVDLPEQSGPVATVRTERGSFTVLGFGGADKHAHAQQQWAIGRTLWARLAERWNRR